MKHFNVPALDGIPGIMPGTITVPLPPEFAEEEIESAQPQDRKKPPPTQWEEHSCAQASYDAMQQSGKERQVIP